MTLDNRRCSILNRHENLHWASLQVERIVRFQAEHGPIADGQQLSAVPGGRPMTAEILERVDFAPSEITAPEAPGA